MHLKYGAYACSGDATYNYVVCYTLMHSICFAAYQ